MPDKLDLNGFVAAPAKRKGEPDMLRVLGWQVNAYQSLSGSQKGKYLADLWYSQSPGSMGRLMSYFHFRIGGFDTLKEANENAEELIKKINPLVRQLAEQVAEKWK